jgi:hypothetical protein
MRKKSVIRISTGSKGQLIAGNGTPLRAIKFNANSPCRCGSGLKTKRCCGVREAYLNSKPNTAADNELKRLGFKTQEA